MKMLFQLTIRCCRGLFVYKPILGHTRFISSTNTGGISDSVESSSGSDSDNFSDREENDAQTSLNDTKNAILSAALSFVPQHGWTKQCLILGAGKAGFPSVTHGLFDRGEIELVEFFYRQSNEQLVGELIKEKEREQKQPTDVFIRNALATRLKMLIPYIDSWPQAMALMSLPTNAPNALRNLTTLVDDIWYHAGDKSVNVDWYTKRISLAMVYGSTQLYMVQDRSEGFQETWSFLNNQLAALHKAGKIAKECQSLVDSARVFCYGAGHVARNIVSVNSRRR